MRQRKTPNRLLYNVTYTYPNGDKKVIVFHNPIVMRESGWELNEVDNYLIEEQIKDDHNFKQSQKPSTPLELTEQLKKDDNRFRSIRRSQSIISHYCHSNNFTHFFTLTLDSNKIEDRKDKQEVFKILTKWLNNQRTKFGKFDYIIVPEEHKDKSIHFHGVMRGYKGNLKPSIKRKGRQVYNITEWDYGFTDCEEIGDIAKVSNYIRKYITKSMIYEFGKKKYFNSKGLVMPKIEYNAMLNADYKESLIVPYINKYCISGYLK